jgi:lysophospholipase L1-like esterase
MLRPAHDANVAVERGAAASSSRRSQTRSRIPKGAGIWAARLLFIIIALAVPVIGLEIGLRWLGPFLPGNYYSGDVYLEPHPLFGRFHVPNTTGWLRTEEYTTRVAINSRGLREREIPHEKPAGVRRIVVLGDSFVEGEEVPEDAMVTRQLEGRLNAPNAVRTEVINGGVRAFGTAQEYLFLKHEALRYQPDVVVLVFYSGNDVADNNPRIGHNVASRHRPYFDLDKGGNLKPLPFRPQRTQQPGIVEQLRRGSLLFSVIDTGVIQKLPRAAGSLDDEESDNDNIQPDRRMVKYELPVFSDAPSGAWDDAWGVTEALLAAARDEANGTGTQFLLAYAPTKWELYPQDWEELRARNGLSDDGWDLNGPRTRVRELAARRGIPYLDLTPGLLREATDGARLYYRSDIHWTPRGHQVTAELLAGALEAGSAMSAPGPEHSQ